MRFLSKRGKRILLAVLLLVPLLWIGGDYLYSRLVAGHVAKWEASLQRNPLGIQLGAASRTLPGDSETALVLVHGFNDTPQAFERMAPALQESGLTVRLVRLPGFGVPLPEMRECTRSQWIEAVLRETTALQKDHSRVILAGHSLGAAVVIAAVLRDPAAADGLVLLAPAIDVSSRRSPLMPTRAWHSLADRLLIFSDVLISPFDKNDARDPAVRNPAYKPSFSTRNVIRQTLQLMAENRDQASGIHLPLLMFVSRTDQVVDWVAAERFFEATASPVRELVFLDDSGHALNVDRDWPTVVSEMVQFINGLPPDE